jgi:hypothetical protein
MLSQATTASVGKTCWTSETSRRAAWALGLTTTVSRVEEASPESDVDQSSSIGGARASAAEVMGQTPCWRP